MYESTHHIHVYTHLHQIFSENNPYKCDLHELV